jgi:hypothetical protein
MEIGAAQRDLARAVVAGQKRQFRVGPGEHDPLQPGAHRAPVHGIGQESAQVPQGRTHRMLAAQQVTSPRSDHMQSVTCVLQDLMAALAIKGPQVGAEQCTDRRGCRPLLPGREFEVLRNVVTFQAVECRHRVLQAGAGHAPGTNRRANQIDRWRLRGSQSPNRNRSSGPRIRPLGPPAAPGMVPTWPGCSPSRASTCMARGPANICSACMVAQPHTALAGVIGCAGCSSRSGPAAGPCRCPATGRRLPSRGR